MIEIKELKRSEIEPDPRNPRQVFDQAQLQELANDIAVRGMLQPILVRPHGKGYMIVFGERRWRATELVDIDTVPAIVRDMNDLDVLEAQIAENNKRADVHPLEEADAYRRLHEEHGREVDEIAELCGKSRAYIYAQMKLCALVPAVRTAFLANRLDKSRALLVARLPAHQQTEACSMLLEEDYGVDGGDVMSYREAQRRIRDEFMLRLVDAPFSTIDASLVTKAGPCTTCEKRTGNQRELFDDVLNDKQSGGADVCTDSACYKQKVDVHWARLKTDAEAKGKKVIEAARYTENGGENDKKHVNLDQPVYEFGMQGKKTYRELLGKNAEGAVAVVARTEHGEIRELISRSDLPALLKDAGVKVPKNAKPGESDQGRYEREAKEQRELEQAVTLAAREAALAKLDDLEQVRLWQLVARLAIVVARNDAQREMVKLHEVSVGDGGQRGALIAFANGLPVRALRDFAVELLIAEGGGWRRPGGESDKDEEPDDWATGLEHAARLLDVDVPAIIEKAKSDLAAARTAKAEKKTKTPPPPADEPQAES